MRVKRATLAPAKNTGDRAARSDPSLGKKRFAQDDKVLPATAGTPSLFGLAPCGVCPARVIAAAAVRSYRTFSPLPRRRSKRFKGGQPNTRILHRAARSDPSLSKPA